MIFNKRPSLFLASVCTMFFLNLISIAVCNGNSDNAITNTNVCRIQEGSVDTLNARSALLQEVVDKLRVQNGIAALQVCVYQSGQNNNCAASGTFRNDRSTCPLQNQHLFRIGSATKLYTAAIIQKCIESGKLDASQTIGTWFPDMKYASNVTIEQLLWQTSGISDYVGSFSFRVKTVYPFKVWHQDEILTLIKKKKLQFTPGDRFAYSNSNYVLLGLIAEKVYNKGLGRLFNEFIVKPIQLKNTAFPPFDTLSPNVISGYEKFGFIKLKHDWDHSSWSTGSHAAGAVVSNAQSLAKFVQALFSGKIISQDEIAAMTRFNRVNDKQNTAWTGYGAGISRFEINNDIWWGHEGLFIGFGSIVLYNPKDMFTIAIVSNKSAFDRIGTIKTVSKFAKRYFLEKSAL